jgi:hypothetical protein
LLVAHQRDLERRKQAIVDSISGAYLPGSKFGIGWASDGSWVGDGNWGGGGGSRASLASSVHFERREPLL